MIKLLRILACLLDYPHPQDRIQATELCTLLQQSSKLPPTVTAALITLTNERYTLDPLDAEERYSRLFDRGRFLSLHLFEHIHGESRDRGQAMVDLLDEYESAGLQLNAQELPDYLPLYLEYLSTCPKEFIIESLTRIAPIVQLLHQRLASVHGGYAACMASLLYWADIPLQTETVAVQPSAFEAENLDELDASWEEASAFAPSIPNTTASGCTHNTQTVETVPVHWTGFQHQPTTTTTSAEEIKPCL